MRRLPRLALGTVQPLADSQPATWALLDVLSRQGLQIQHFRSQACFAPRDGVPSAITGLSSRHLDTWSMSEEVCCEVFARAADACDLAVVEGRYQATPIASAAQSQLDLLCQWLCLPRLVIVDVSQLGNCQLPTRPQGADGVILDQLGSAADLSRLQTLIETLWGVPVLGALEQLPRLRRAIAEVPVGEAPPRELCQQLGDNLRLRTDVARLRELAGRYSCVDCRPQLFRPEEHEPAIKVAVAFDAAFHCYFPDTLDLLELRGARVVDFSPLRDEGLPAETDIVYFGCGHPEQFARELAGNHCMIATLRNHVCSGRRIYAEGGGLAYLCRQIELPDGRQLPMAGALPAAARLNPDPVPPYPHEATLAAGNWLGAAGTTLRGYLNSYWLIERGAELTSFLADSGHEGDLIGRHHAIGSRLHLNFAALPQVFSSFLQPHAASLEWAHGRRSGVE